MTTPCDKHEYATANAAHAACAHIHSKNGMKVYKCNECGMFHITSVKKNKATFKIKEKYKHDYTGIKPLKKKEIKAIVKSIKQDYGIITTYKPFAFLKQLL